LFSVLFIVRNPLLTALHDCTFKSYYNNVAEKRNEKYRSLQTSIDIEPNPVQKCYHDVKYVDGAKNIR